MLKYIKNLSFDSANIAQAKIKAGQQTSGSCNRDRNRFYQLECPFLSNTVDVELAESTGRCSLYVSEKISNPTSYFNTTAVVRDETTTGSTRRCSLSLKNTKVRILCHNYVYYC